MISRSRAGRRRRLASRASSSFVQLGMFDLRDRGDRADELLPRLFVLLEHAAAFGREVVEAPPPLAGLLDPAPLEPAALLEAIEQRVQRRDVELDLAAGAQLYELADLVAVTRARLDDRQHDELGGAFLQFAG